MPYLRYTRDKRGYEHTYVLHGSRTGGRPRILYWFRTPPNVSVGRTPFDDDALRAIEESNPSLTFDWFTMRRERPRPPARRIGTAVRATRRRPEGPKSDKTAEALSKTGVAAGVEDGAVEEIPSDATAVQEGSSLGLEDRTPMGVSSVFDEPLGIDGDVNVKREGEFDSVLEDEHPVAVLLGKSALAVFRERYAALRKCLLESSSEAPAHDVLTSRVAALNPDTWQPGEEVVLGIERFESEIQAIRAELKGE